ncbi:hypothetical protein JXA32_08195 [Candidatus Sumerlaeota bacterium]|nr:hypothetical protein [Candidatus Sumerlaeota bacterium]
MAVFAVNEDGSGGSKCYVAQDRDITIYQLPSELQGTISFVRYTPWITTHKKGWCGSGADYPTMVEASWWYDWDNADTSTDDMEYVPMRHNLWWNAYSNIVSKTGSPHALGFNEPDSSDQADMTVAQCIEQWPYLEAAGLRLGSPAPTDGGLDYLYEFLDSAETNNRRVDFVAVHMYKGGWSGSNVQYWLNDINVQGGKPIWVTEWNNGCTWTGYDPADEDEQADIIQDFIDTMNGLNYVERYAVYNWCGDVRMLIDSDGVITPAGEVYRDTDSPVAYQQETYAYEGDGSGASNELVLYWAFNGNASDSSGNGLTGTVNGDATYATGHISQALSCDGYGDTVSLAYTSELALSNFTIATWVNVDTKNDVQGICGTRFGVDRTFDLKVATTYIHCDIGDGTSWINTAVDIPSTAGGNLTAGQWYHICYAVDGDAGEVRMYINGALCATATLSSVPLFMQSGQTLHVGDSSGTNTTEYMDGMIDDFRIYNYALSASEVATLANM